ncbi:MAG TPA: hypothetical protein DCW88_06745 [Agrobacterium sp.]|uniref:DUF2635 domain-containing protein n=1 Tax=Agrobacterium pusense TaxID=648995 RepID=UPI000E8345CC|nr:hypothetical protein [Agrobacterium sp.]
MATQKVLIAADGRTVHLPDGSEWPKEGLPDPDTHFTRRRIADGDLLVTTVQVAEPEAPADAPQLAQIEAPTETPAETKRSPAKKSEGDK